MSPLAQHKDRFFGIFESCLVASNEYNLLRLSGLTGLKLMILSKGYLESNEVGLAVQSINKILLDEQDEELRSAALEALRVTSQINSKYINELTVPSLIDRLPESTDGNTNYLHVLYALRVLSPVPSVYKHAMPLLIKKFDTVCANGKLYFGLNWAGFSFTVQIKTRITHMPSLRPCFKYCESNPLKNTRMLLKVSRPLCLISSPNQWKLLSIPVTISSYSLALWKLLH